ncbi:tetratricopeptide repeat protein [Deinococcus sp. Arct2-2]|nr:tetratricopeptide repeat protein [Deinococcus sp. Arct2-2]
MQTLTEGLPPADRLFERGAAFDSTGHPQQAASLYREALAAGLVGERRRRAVIQLASSLRNLGQAEEALTLLTAEAGQPSDALDGAVALFTALTLADLGREREGLAVAQTALVQTLSPYNRYREALAAGLPHERRRRAVIQRASSLRQAGQTEEALVLLSTEAGQPSDALDGAVAIFLALTLADLGREREALAVALTALAQTLPRYNRSAARYAGALLETSD